MLVPPPLVPSNLMPSKKVCCESSFIEKFDNVCAIDPFTQIRISALLVFGSFIFRYASRSTHWPLGKRAEPAVCFSPLRSASFVGCPGIWMAHAIA